MLIAVVVPNVDNAGKWGEKNGYGKGYSYSGLCCLKQLEEYVIQELRSTADRNKVMPGINNNISST